MVKELTEAGYAVLRCINSGGASTLFQCRQEMLSRDVAVKVLRTDYDQVTLERFKNESRLLSSFDHPNIVQFFGYGMLASGEPYFVMEYLEGDSLRTYLEQKGTLAEEEVRRIGAWICDALEYAHKSGIIHRDLKPDNIMMVLDEGLSVKLIDFGIHKNRDFEGQIHTRTGSLPGTANYMSPEQCQGGSVDGRSDLYALGCILYELLCGRPPMDAETDWLVMNNHLHKDVKTIPCRQPISAELSSGILKALKRTPALRWSDAAQFGQMLRSPWHADSDKRSVYAWGVGAILAVLATLVVSYAVSRESRQSDTVPTIGIKDKKMKFDAYLHSISGSAPGERMVLCRKWLQTHSESASWKDIVHCMSSTGLWLWPDCPGICQEILGRTTPAFEQLCKRSYHDANDADLIAAHLLATYYARVGGNDELLSHAMKLLESVPTERERVFKIYLNVGIFGNSALMVKVVDRYLNCFDRNSYRACLLALRSRSNRDLGNEKRAIEDAKTSLGLITEVDAEAVQVLETLTSDDRFALILDWYAHAHLKLPSAGENRIWVANVLVVECLEGARRYTEALTLSKKLRGLGCDEHEDALFLSELRCYAAAHDEESALAALKKLISLGNVQRVDDNSYANRGLDVIRKKFPGSYFKTVALLKDARCITPLREASLHASYGDWLRTTRKPELAIAYFNEALKISEKTGHGQAAILNGLSLAHGDLGQYAKALGCTNKALTVARPESIEYYYTCALKGVFLRHLGRTDDALAVHEAACNQCSNGTSYGLNLRELCLDYACKGKLDYARNLAKRNWRRAACTTEGWAQIQLMLKEGLLDKEDIATTAEQHNG